MLNGQRQKQCIKQLSKAQDILKAGLRRICWLDVWDRCERVEVRLYNACVPSKHFRFSIAWSMYTFGHREVTCLDTNFASLDTEYLLGRQPVSEVRLASNIFDQVLEYVLDDN